MSIEEALLGVPKQSPYGMVSQGIESLYSTCLPVTELKAGSQTIKSLRGDLHGFTVSPVGYDFPLPLVVKDFLKEGVRDNDNRLDIYTSVF